MNFVDFAVTVDGAAGTVDGDGHDVYLQIETVQGTADAEELISWIESKGGTLRWRDAGISIKPISETGTRRIFQFAFDYARRMDFRDKDGAPLGNILTPQPALLMDGADLTNAVDVGLGIDGLLGLNFLKSFRMTLDFQRDVLLLRTLTVSPLHGYAIAAAIETSTTAMPRPGLRGWTSPAPRIIGTTRASEMNGAVTASVSSSTSGCSGASTM